MGLWVGGWKTSQRRGITTKHAAVTAKRRSHSDRRVLDIMLYSPTSERYLSNRVNVLNTRSGGTGTSSTTTPRPDLPSRYCICIRSPAANSCLSRLVKCGKLNALPPAPNIRGESENNCRVKSCDTLGSVVAAKSLGMEHFPALLERTAPLRGK